ncbi:hypothetical protein [Baaleninema sp.]|uniref:hypothetical protein n=1 Tax=Baaleninema sp. TaxID=3101197 RepID=UPI003D01898F
MRGEPLKSIALELLAYLSFVSSPGFAATSPDAYPGEPQPGHLISSPEPLCPLWRSL